MGAPDAAITPAPRRPYPNRADSVWRGCTFASVLGWPAGFNFNGGTPLHTENDQNRQHGIATGGPGSMYQKNAGGYEMNAGISEDRVDYESFGGTIYDPNNRWCSCFGLAATDNVLEFGGEAIIGSKENFGNSAGYALVNGGNGGGPGHPFFSYELSDGVTTLIAVSAQTPVDDQVYRVAGRYDRSGSGTAEIWIDGKLDGSATGALDPEPPTGVEFNLFSYDATEPIQSRNVLNVGMAWNRLIADAEIQRLQVDPYRPWRWDLHKEFMFGPGASLGVFNTFFMAF